MRSVLVRFGLVLILFCGVSVQGLFAQTSTFDLDEQSQSESSSSRILALLNLLRQNPSLYAEQYVKPYVVAETDSLAPMVLQELSKMKSAPAIVVNASLNNAAEARLNSILNRKPIHPLLNVKTFTGSDVRAYLGYSVEDEADAVGVLYEVLRENYLLSQKQDVDMPIMSAEISRVGIHQVSKSNGCLITVIELTGEGIKPRTEAIPGIGMSYKKSKSKFNSDTDCPPSALITKKKPKKRPRD